MKSKGKKKVKEEEVMNKEEISESYCFVCKEGGDLLICDHRECLKCFHPGCVGKDDSFDDHWECDRHTCFRCRRSAYRYCYTCKNSVCSRCLPAADIVQIKGKYGLCHVCLKLVLLIEENKDYDSDGAKVDFTDLTTVEGLFRGYYHIIKDEEGFELKDIYAAVKRTKIRNEHQSASDLEEDEEDEDQISEYDGTDDESKCKRMKKKRGSKKTKSAIQTSVKSNKNEFIDWASRSLAEFLTSIGKSTKEKMMQYDVTSIINEYVKEKNLLHPKKRKMIVCDARLCSLFRRRTINRNRVYELLKPHFAENHDESEEDELDYDSEDENAGISEVCKRQKKLNIEKESPKAYVEDNVQTSCFASIVVENMKLIYLKRSMLHELLKQPKSFEEKVIGCFVRVKSDPRDYSTKNSHQLRQVEGFKRVSNVENSMEVALLFSVMPKEISIDLLSDGDFLEEECEELRQKMVAGQLKRPTVGDLQQKARILHEVITKHWINRELHLLQRRIDRANEKGWRREFYELLEKKKRLETPSEQSKLLGNVPKVIPDVCELDSNSEDIINDINSDKASPQSILPCNSSVTKTGWKEDKVSEQKAHHDHAQTEPPQVISGTSVRCPY